MSKKKSAAPRPEQIINFVADYPRPQSIIGLPRYYRRSKNQREKQNNKQKTSIFSSHQSAKTIRLKMGLRTDMRSLYNWAFQRAVLYVAWHYFLFISLPFNFLVRRLEAWRDWAVLWLNFAPRAHSRKVAFVQRQVRKWHQQAAKGQKMCTGQPMEQCQRMCFSRPAYKQALYSIKLDNLKDIVEIKTEAKTVRVEPQVTVDQLQRALLPLGFTLPVVPELGHLPIGGLIQGAGIGSGSARSGLFQHTYVAFEVVTASGEVVVAEKDGEHQSLFFGIPWSLGTLGFLVSATLQIRPCPPLVRLVYQPCLSTKELAGRLQEESLARAGNDFVEAIQFDRDRAVLVSGKLVEQVPKNDPGSLNAIGRWHKPFFYEHTRRAMEQGTTLTEYVPSRDYFRRHWRSFFWLLPSMFPFALPPLFLFRWLFGWMLPAPWPLPSWPRVRRIFGQSQLIQNVLVPAKSVPDILELLDTEFQIYPLWLCPVVLPAQPGLLRNRHGLKAIYVNVGIYGAPKRELSDGKKAMAERLRTLEEHTRQSQGFQMLCADSHQSAAEFWEMFDATLYDWLRAKYDCKAALPNVYEKVCMANRCL